MVCDMNHIHLSSGSLVKYTVFPHDLTQLQFMNSLWGKGSSILASGSVWGKNRGFLTGTGRYTLEVYSEHTYIDTHTHTHTHRDTYTHAHKHTDRYTEAHTHTYTQRHTHIQRCTHTHSYTDTHTHTDTYMDTK